MPELPEVETICQDLNQFLLNKNVQSVKVFSTKSVYPSVFLFSKNLVGRKIKKIQRRGKLLIFYLSVDKLPRRSRLSKTSKLKINSNAFNYLLIHLRLTGQLVYLDKKIKLAGGHSLNPLVNKKSAENSLVANIGGQLPNHYTRAQINFLNAGQLFFNDLRKFGYLKLVNKAELEYILNNNYGPEPLTSEFSLIVFRNLLRGRTMKIKALLLNQRIVAGLGNIYVDESLWRARIKPTRSATSLTITESRKLYQVINRLIKQAIKYRGTTFNSYVDSRGKQGNFSRLLKVYGRAGQACHNCGTLLLKTRVAGRGTSYCPACQK